MEQFSWRWEQVDLKRGLITLPTTKVGDVQSVRLNEEARMLLRELDEQATKEQAVAEAEAIASKRERDGKRSVWVFPSENLTTHIDPQNFYRRVYLPKVKEIGLEGVSWHTLRHTFASRLAMSGATEGTIASLLRHSGTILVRRYAHLSPSHLQDEIEKVLAFGKVGEQSTAKEERSAEGAKPTEVVGEQPSAEGPTGEFSVPTVTGTVTGGQGL